jgi:preprotein translocase subunit SecA
MNDQRNYIYSKRGEFLEEVNIEEKIDGIIEELITQITEEQQLPRSGITHEAVAEVIFWFSDVFKCGAESLFDKSDEISLEELEKNLMELAVEQHRTKTLELGEEIAPQVERFIALQSIDRRWKEHLYEMDGLREGIGYQAYAQKDPLIEYKFQAFNLFQELIKNINTDIIKNIFKVRLVPSIQKPKIWRINKVQHEEYDQFHVGKSNDAGADYDQQELPHQAPVRTQVFTGKKVGRNEPCPCGSGKKYKYCCGR